MGMFKAFNLREDVDIEIEADDWYHAIVLLHERDEESKSRFPDDEVPLTLIGERYAYLGDYCIDKRQY